MKNKGLGLVKPVKELISQEAKLDPFTWFEKMRVTQPIRYDEERGCWDVFCYDDILSILKNYNDFSSNRPEPVLVSSIIRMDPPRHTQMRGIISNAFTPRLIKDLEPRIKDIAGKLINETLVRESMEVIQDFSYALAIIVIADLLGVPSEDHYLFKKWSDIIAKGASDDSPSALKEVIREKNEVREELNNYFSRIVSERKRNPQNDLITKLVEARIDGKGLTDIEILEFCHLLLVAGNETTTNLIANFIRRMAEDKSLEEQLRLNPGLIKNAIEETLRFYPPVLNTSRFAANDYKLRGHQINKGDQIVLWIGSANRDEQQFENPNKFDINRSSIKHLTFGQSIHFCLGAPLARLEAQIAIQILLEMIKDIEFNTAKLNPIQSCLVYGCTTLPIKFKSFQCKS
ncbi:cytochrome P450 [Bacillus cereus]|nr:cytochrome P450 [Bacillus cereus]